MMQKVSELSENESKNVCYIIIGHGPFVDDTGHIVDFMTKNKIPLSKLQPEDHDIILDHLNI